MMIELTSTPIILMVILGVAGMIIPVINVLRRERGSSTFYGLIAFGALLISLGYVIYRFYTDSVADAAIFSSDVLVDDGFGSFFAIAMPVSYTHLRAHETGAYLVCRLLLEKKKR